MLKVLMSPDGKRVVVDTEKDHCLYQSPVNPPNTGTRYTRGTDLYYHKARSGNEYFYFYHWSLWQAEEGRLDLVSREQAEKFLLEKAGLTGWGALDERDFERLRGFGFDLLSEDA